VSIISPHLLAHSAPGTDKFFSQQVETFGDKLTRARAAITAFLQKKQLFLCPSSSQLLLNVWKTPLVDSTAAVLVSALCNGNKIFTCGNGGSAADALHMSEELLGRYKRERAALPATVLSLIQPFLHASAMITGSIIYLHGKSRAWANRATSSFSSPTAETLSISLKRSKLQDAKSFSQSLFRVSDLPGKDGGQIAGTTDYEIIVPSGETARVQKIHTVILDSWLDRIDSAFAVTVY
jgi:phosphoheptose isomerase